MRGSAVIVDFRPNDPAAKVRPALIVQNDRDNVRMGNTIVAQVTSNIRRAHEATQLLIDQTHPDWQQSGLRLPSVVNCSNLATVEKRIVRATIGSLSAETMREVEDCLRKALGL